MRRPMYVILFVFAFIVFLTSCSHQLETGLTEKDAQQIVVTLRENGIDAAAEMEAGQKKDVSSWRVNVKGGNDTVITAWKILSEHGLPREKVKGLDDVFANSGMIPTAVEEKARLTSALEGELTRTLNSLTSVVDTRVQVVLPENSPLLDKTQQTPPTASVLIQYRDNAPPLKEAEIKNLVARGVEGLTPENVAVVLKKVETHTIPERFYGSWPATDWFLVAALALAAIASLGSLTLLFISKRRSLRIKRLEQQLTEAKGLQKMPRAAA